MKKILLLFLLIILNPTVIHAQRGCCSHHGGVSGCSQEGRQICRDGTLSPSCTCTPTIKYIYGCMNSNAKNYNPSANKDSGNCIYYKYGCTNPDSINYDETAEKDDNSCIPIVYGCMDRNASNYNVEANKEDNSCTYLELENSQEEIEKGKKESEENGFGVMVGCGIYGTIMLGILKKLNLC